MSSHDELVNLRIEAIRPRLLDTSRRNPLLNNVLSTRTARYISVVDEKPQNIIQSLVKGKPFIISPLPPLDDDELPDELTSEFLTAFGNAKQIDEDFIEANDRIDFDSDDRAFETVALIERDLKDRLRKELGLPDRPISKQKSDLVNHAKIHGIDPSITLPLPSFQARDKRHEDSELQTLLLPSTLETRVRQKIIPKQREFEEERGLQVTYLVVGYLEWKLEDEGLEEKAYKSPLILIPVKVSREKSEGGHQCSIVKTTEIIFNPILRHKFEADLGIDLHETIQIEESDFEVEEFYKEFEAIKPRRMKTWKIKREATLGIYPFQGIELHHDLRQDGIDFSEFSILNHLLLGRKPEERDGVIYSEGDIDTNSAENKVPHLVLDADSSQFLSLLRVSNGENVAMEGPPGSGKSQTIVNAIANALYHGKRVLFVAQKKTALDVVFARLKPLGLDKFVLPLLSSKGDSDRFYNAVSDRIQHRKSRYPKEIDELRLKYKRSRSKLKKYIELLTSSVGETRLSVHDVLGLAIKHSHLIQALPSNLKAVKFDLDKMSAGFDLSAFENACDELSKISDQLRETELDFDSPWFDSDLQQLDLDQVNPVLNRGGIVCDSLQLALNGYLENNAEIDSLLSSCLPNELQDAVDLLRDVAVLGHDCWSLLSSDVSVSESKAQSLKLKIQERSKLLAGNRLSLEEFSVISKHIEDVKLLLKFLEWCGLSDIRDSSISSIIVEKRTALKRLEDLQVQNSILDQSGASLSPYQISALYPIVQGINDIDWLHDCIKESSLSTALSELFKFRKYLKIIFEQLRPGLSLPSSREVFRLKKILVETGTFGRWLGKPYSQAIKTLRDWFGISPMESLKRDDFILRVDIVLDAILEVEKLSVSDLIPELDYTDEGSIEIGRSLLVELDSRLSTWELSSLPINILLDEPAFEKVANEIDGMPGIHLQFDWVFLSEDIRQVNEFIFAFEDYEVALDKALVLCKERNIIKLEAIKRVAVDSDHFSQIQILIANLTMELNLSVDSVTNELLEQYISVLGRYARTSDSITETSFFEIQGSLSCCVEALLPDLGDLNDLYQKLLRAKGLPESQTNIREQISSVQAHVSDQSGFSKLLSRKEAIQLSIDSGFGNLLQLLVVEGCLDRADELSRASLVNHLKLLVESEYGSKIMKSSGSGLKAARSRFQELDRKLIALASKAVSSTCISNANPPAGVGRGRKSEFTEQCLINHELGKSRRIPPRKLLRRAGRALEEWFPCWMMDPNSVAQHIRREQVFDLVIIDEASQMTPEMSVSALMRGKNALISGDTNQLPPTSYFKGIITDDDIDEDVDTSEESILELANISFHPKHRLKWHYRSRHESLIAFSNHYVYDDELVIFPSPIGERKDMGVSLERVMGSYVNRINPVEAQIMTDRVVSFMKDRPDRSLGVVVMNQPQMEQIEANVLRAADEDPDVSKYIDKWARNNSGLERFFVKNLENVQGDERDVIFIGTVYGKDPLGKFAQRFGPINGSAGKRRLNVLFTRAKEQMVTFSSIPLGEFQPRETNEGAKLLKLWLEYCHTKKLGEKISQSDMGGVPDSPFEEHVISIINQFGFIAVPQVGVSNYHIDVGVRHPEYPFGYLCGIECDGATYHSSKSARDRDRLRQEVLENLGWELYRIWSTDWFYDTVGQAQILKEYLHKLLRKKLENLPHPLILEPKGEYVNLIEVEEPLPPTEALHSTSRSDGRDSNFNIDSIAHGCRVVVRDLDGARAGQARAYWISNHAAEDERPHKEFDLLKPFAPLSQALMGAYVGDVVSYNVNVLNEIREYRVEVVSCDCD